MSDADYADDLVILKNTLSQTNPLLYMLHIDLQPGQAVKIGNAPV